MNRFVHFLRQGSLILGLMTGLHSLAISAAAQPLGAVTHLSLQSSGSCDETGVAVALTSGLGAVGDLNRWPVAPISRNWMVFQVPGDLASVTGAVLNITQIPFPTNYPTVYPTTPESLVFFQVSTPIETLRPPVLGSRAWFDDLGDGEIYGQISPELSTWGFFSVSVQLNEAFLRDLKSHAGRPLILGGSMASLDGVPGNGEAFFDREQLVFGNASLQLQRDCSGSPVVSRELIQYFDSAQNNEVLQVAACGREPLSYFWFRDGVSLGPQTSRLTVPRTPGSQGVYSVVVSNELGRVSSQTVLVPEIGWRWLQEPLDLDLPEQSKGALTSTLGIRLPCGPQGCSRVFTTVWLKDGLILGEPPLLSGGEILFPRLELEGNQVGGRYQVVVSSPELGSITSRVARVKPVRLPPFIATQLRTNILAPYLQPLLLDPEIREGGPPATFTWFFNDAPIQSSLSSAALSIASMQESQAGNYQLVASNEVGSVTSEIVRVVVGPSPFRFTFIPSPPVLLLENPISLWVRVEGSSPSNPVLKVFRGNFPNGVEASIPVLQRYPSVWELGLQAASAEQGTYWLVASAGPVNITSPPVLVRIEAAAPRFTFEPSDTSVNAGEWAFFASGAEGGPPPTYRWFLQDRPIRGATNQYLNLESVSRAAAGDYYVVASNSIGATTSRLARLTVISSAPQFTRQPADASIAAGKPFFLEAIAVGIPSPSLQWFFAGKLIKEATNSALIFNFPTRTNDGAYWAVARNLAGSSTSAIAQLKVVGSPPEFTFHPTDVRAPVGKPVTVFAEAKGAPAPAFIWEHEGKSSTKSLDGLLNLGTNGLSDQGRYRAIATNDYGSATSLWVNVTRLARERTNLWTLVTNDVSKDVAVLLVDDSKIWVGAKRGVWATDFQGQPWLDTFSHTAGDVTGLVRGNGRLVVVSDKGQVQWTEDGFSWTVSEALLGHPVNGIGFFKGRFVAVGTDQIVHVSSNLVDWASSLVSIPRNPSGEPGIEPSPASFNGITTGLGQLVIVGGYVQAADALILTSEDGDHWFPYLPRTGKRLRAVHFAEGMFVAVGNDGEVVASEDGKAWTRRMSGVRIGGLNLRDVTYWAGRWIAVGTGGILCSSPDARIWSVHHLPGVGALQAVAGVGGRLLVAGEASDLRFASDFEPRLDLTIAGPKLTLKSGWLSRTLVERSTDLQIWEHFRELTGDQESFTLELSPLAQGSAFFRVFNSD